MSILDSRDKKETVGFCCLTASVIALIKGSTNEEGYAMGFNITNCRVLGGSALAIFTEFYQMSE